MKTKLLLLFVLLPFLGFSCDCLHVFETPILYKLNTATKVFKGTVIDIKQREDGFGYHYKFLVNENIKSTTKGSTQTVWSGASSCGITFKKGESWLIFTHEDNNSGICSGNVRLDQNFKVINNPKEYHNENLEEHTHYYNKLEKILQKYVSSSATKLTEFNSKGLLISEGTLGENKQPLQDWKYTFGYQSRRLLGSWKLKKVTSKKTDVKNTNPPLMIYTFTEDGKVQMIAKNSQNGDINIMQSFSTYIKNNKTSTKYIKIELAESELQFINPTEMIITMNAYGGMIYHFEKVPNIENELTKTN